MALIPKGDQTEAPVLVGRRSTRLSVAVPILISGTDASGNPFKEHTFTLNVNKHGAEIATSHPLPADVEISIENISLGRKGLARVVQRRERRTPNSPYEVSLELVDPGNIWGVRFPPSDWEKDSKGDTPASDKSTPAMEKTEALAPLLHDPEKAEGAPAESLGTSLPAASIPPPVAIPADVSMADPSEAQGESPKPEAKSVEETAAGLPAVEIGRKVEAGESSGNEIAPSLPAASAGSESATSSEAAGLEEKIETARSAGQLLQDVLQRLEATSSQLENLLSRVSDTRKTLQSELESARAEIRESGRQAAQSAKEELGTRLRSELETASLRAIEETRPRLQEEVSAAVAAFAKQAGAHLSKLTQESGPELEAKQKLAVGLAKEQITKAAETTANEFAAQLGNSAEERSRSLSSQMKASLEKSAADSASLLTQSLRAKAEAFLESEDGPIQKVRRQLADESRGAADKFRASCAEEALRAGREAARELEKASSTLRKSAEEANAGLWEAGKAIKHDLTFKAEKLQKHLADIASASEQGFQNYTEVQVKGAQEEVREHLRTLAAKNAQEFSEQLQKTAESVLESNAPQLQRQAEDALVLCKATLEVATQEMLQETQMRLANLALESVRTYASEAASATEHSAAQLQESLQVLLTRAPLDLQAELRKTGEEEEQAISARIEMESRRAADRVIAEIKNRTEAAAKEASDTVYKQVGVATIVLKDWGDQAAARLEGQLKNSMDAFQRQVQELMTSALEANRRQTEASTLELRRRLDQASRILSTEGADSSRKDSSSSGS